MDPKCQKAKPGRWTGPEWWVAGSAGFSGAPGEVAHSLTPKLRLAGWVGQAERR